MNKKTIRIAGWALALSMAVAGIGAAIGTSHLIGKNSPTMVKAESTTLDLSFENIGSDGWSNSYASHSATFTDGTVTFSGASKQTSNITDVPVMKNNTVNFVLGAGKMFSSVTFTCRQWTTKTQTLTLKKSTDGGSSFSNFSPSITSTSFSISASDMATGINAVQLSASETNQVGIVSITYELAAATPIEASVSINDVVNNKAAIYVDSPMTFVATSVLGDDGVGLRWSVSNETCTYTLSETSGASTVFTPTSEGSARLTVDVLDSSDGVLASDYVVITATEDPYVRGQATLDFASGNLGLTGKIGDYLTYTIEKGSASYDPNDAGTHARIYAGAYITFASSDPLVTFEYIDMRAACSAGDKPFTVTPSTGTPATLTCTSTSETSLTTWVAGDDCSSVTFNATTNQFRLYSAVIHYKKEKAPSIKVNGLTTVDASVRVDQSKDLALTTEYVDLNDCDIEGPAGYDSYVSANLDVAESKLTLTGVAKTTSPVALLIKLNSTTLLTVNVTVSNNVVTADVKGTIEVGEDAAITASSSDYVSDTFTYSSSNTSVATVSAAGVVHGEEIGGPVVITVTSNTDGSSTTVSVSVVKTTTHIAKAGSTFDFGATTLPANWAGTSATYYSTVQSFQGNGQYIENDKIAPSSGTMTVVRASLKAFTSYQSSSHNGSIKFELLNDGEPISGANTTIETTYSSDTDKDNVLSKLDAVEPLVVDLTAAGFNGFRISGTNAAKVCLGELTLSYFETVEEEANDWADAFLALTEGHCDANTNAVASVWEAAEAAYAKYTEAAKTLFVDKLIATKGVTDGTKLGDAAARYYFAVANHDGANIDFTGSNVLGLNRMFSGFSNAETIVPFVVTAAVLGSAAIAGFFLFQRKRKEF